MKRSSLLDLCACSIGGMSKVCDSLVNAILNSVDLTCFQCLVALQSYLPSFGHNVKTRICYAVKFFNQSLAEQM